MELWDLYNEHREKTGEKHVRGEEIPENRYHLVVHVWIQNAEGKFLISKRSAKRPTFPLMWECVGGSVLENETSLEGAIREVREEVGIKLLPAQGNLLFSQVRKVIDGKKFNDILDVWLFSYDGEASLQEATTDEVADAQWMTIPEIQEFYDAGKLVDTLKYFFNESMQKRLQRFSKNESIFV